MASWLLSKCGLKSLPKILPIPRTRTISNHQTKPPFQSDLRFSSSKFSTGSLKRRSLELKVSAPLRVTSVEGEDRGERVNGNNGVGEREELGFDPGLPPPFRLADIRAAIPKHCWVKDPWRSMSYVMRDVVVVFGLVGLAIYFNNWVVWPFYRAAQGTMFWALFVLGHDWRISHRTHHQNHGNAENDESWHPELDNATRTLRFTVPFPCLLILSTKSLGKTGSHFDPNGDLFVPTERKDVITSTLCWTAMAAFLVVLAFVIGPVQLLKLYGVPYWVFVM